MTSFLYANVEDVFLGKEKGGRRFENRTLADGSVYLAKPYSPTSAPQKLIYKSAAIAK